MSEQTPEQPTAEALTEADAATEHGNADWVQPETVDNPAAPEADVDEVVEARPHAESEEHHGDDEAWETGDPAADPAPADPANPEPEAAAEEAAE